MDRQAKVVKLIMLWMIYSKADPKDPESFERTKTMLYEVRNPGFNGSRPLSAWPKELVADDEIMAAVEHYFLTRWLVGTGRQPAWEMRAQVWVYDFGKKLGVTPATNPNKPVTPPSALQRYFQERGISDGERDLARTGKKAPAVASPMTYTRT